MALFAKTYGLPPVPMLLLHVLCYITCETLGDRCQDDWVVQENANAAVDESGSGNDNHIGGCRYWPWYPYHAIRDCGLPLFIVIVAKYFFICIHQLITNSIVGILKL